jgi:hypothetical protein
MGHRIVLELARWERRAEMRAAYDALVADLEALGCDVEVSDAVERRGGGTEFTPALADVVVHLREDVEGPLLEALLAAVRARVDVHAHWPRKRTAVVLAPDGEMLHRLPLSGPAERGAPG